MARIFSTYNMPLRTPAANPETLCQVKAGTNSRVVLHQIDVLLFGSSGATAPLLFQVATQDGAGTSSDGSSNLVANLIAGAETLQTTMLQVFTGEPSTNTLREQFSLHQQGARSWHSGAWRGEMLIIGGARLGIRYVNGSFVACRLVLHLEE